MPEIPDGMAPARYKGLGAGLQQGVKHRNADGTLRKDTKDKKQALSLEPGDEMLWRDEDVYGKTLWHDPNQTLRSKYVGLGRCKMKGDEEKAAKELIEMGYEFHDPRPDLEPIIPLEAFLAQRKRKHEPQEIPQEVELPEAGKKVSKK